LNRHLNFLQNLCTHSHFQILCNNLVNCTFINMKLIGDHLNYQTLILMYESPHTVDVYVRPQAGGQGVQNAVHVPPFLVHLRSLCAMETLQHVMQNHYLTLSKCERDGRGM
jgi:hypothetical protein